MGRADELAELVALLDAALDGRPGFAVIAGEPGIGKTRLAEELAALAGARAVPVLWGGCTAAEGAPAYWPWRRILRSWLALVGPRPRRCGDGRVRRGRAAGARAARRARRERPVRALRRRRPLPRRGRRGGRARARPRRRAVGRRRLAGAARPRDPGGDAGAAAGRRHRPARRARPRTGRAGDRAVGLGRRGGRRRAGRRLGGRPDPDVVAAVARRSGGNPFFVGELARAGAAALRVPAAVRDVVRARIRRLPEPCRALLGAAAVLGRDVDAALLSAVTGVDGVLDDLRPALDDGVLDHPAGRVDLRFTHDLVRESVLADLAAAEQARVHLAVVAALDALGRRPGRGRRARPPRARRAARGRPACRDRLGPAGGPGGAQPPRLRRGGPAAGRRARRRASGARPGRAARPCCWSWPAPGASRTTWRARSRRSPRPPSWPAPPATRRASPARRSGCPRSARRRGSTPCGAGARRRCGASARGTARSRRSSSPRSRTARCSWRIARAIADAGAAALAMAERLDDPASLAIALRARQLARSGADGNAERLVLGGRLLALGERTGDPEDVLWGRLWRFDALLQAGRVADAEAELAAVEPVVAALRRPLARLHLLRGRVALALGRGRFAEGRALNEETVAIAERGGHFGASATARSLRIGIAARAPAATPATWSGCAPTRPGCSRWPR